jgi:hypothetical protein
VEIRGRACGGCTGDVRPKPLGEAKQVQAEPLRILNGTDLRKPHCGVELGQCFDEFLSEFVPRSKRLDQAVRQR